MVEDDRTVIIRPISTFTSSTPTRFEMRPPYDEYMLLNESDLYLKIKFTLKHATEKITREAWKKITVAPHLMHSMFRFVNLIINGRQVNISPSLYPYRSYLDAHLGFTEKTKSGFLSSVACENGLEMIMDGTTEAKPETSVIELQGMLHLDLSFQEKAIFGGTPVTIELIPHDPSFYLRGSSGYSVEVSFEDTYFKCERLKVVPAVADGHDAAVKQHMTRYPFTRTEVRHRTIPANVNDFQMDNIFSGLLPRRLIIGFVSNNTFNGIGDGTPFDFKDYGVNFLTTYVNGRQIPNLPFTPDFDAKLTTREFHGLYKALNQTGSDSYYSKSLKEWRQCPLYGINYAVDLSNGGSMSSHVNKRQIGQLGIHVKFKTKNADPIVCVVMSETDCCLEIDELRQAHIDY